MRHLQAPRRVHVRQLDGAFLFGHERIVAYPDRTEFFGITSRFAGNPVGRTAIRIDVDYSCGGN